MESLKALSSQELHVQTVGLAEKERALGVEILHHLREIERRRYYAVLGYPSLWEYCVTELKYSAGAAHRRISSMRLMKEIPSVEEALQDGRLNLTTVASAQRFLKEQEKVTSGAGSGDSPSTTIEQKVDLLRSLENKTTREVEKVFATLLPKIVPQEQKRVLTENQIEVRFVLDAQLNQDLERIKDVAAGALGMNPTYAELFQWMASKVLQQIDPKIKAQRAVKRKEAETQKRAEVTKQEPSKMVAEAAEHIPPLQTCRVGKKPTPSAPEVEKIVENRYIPAAARHGLFERENCCGYFDDRTGRRCAETRGLEIDHATAYALGGSSDPDNLRLRCKTHNLLHAQQTFGLEKMHQYWP